MDKEIENLISKAREVQERAYAPYSKFKVGVAILGKDNRVFTGCNVENVAYGHSLCAERVAITKAVSEGCRDFEILVVTTDNSRAVSPCGACRQFLVEFSPNCKVVMVGQDELEESTAQELLPRAFKPPLEPYP